MVPAVPLVAGIHATPRVDSERGRCCPECARQTDLLFVVVAILPRQPCCCNRLHWYFHFHFHLYLCQSRARELRFQYRPDRQSRSFVVALPHCCRCYCLFHSPGSSASTQVPRQSIGTARRPARSTATGTPTCRRGTPCDSRRRTPRESIQAMRVPRGAYPVPATERDRASSTSGRTS